MSRHTCRMDIEERNMEVLVDTSGIYLVRTVHKGVLESEDLTSVFNQQTE